MSALRNETSLRLNIHQLDALPEEEGKRYELIDGELHVTTQPHWNHQWVCTRLIGELARWSKEGERGEVVPAPGVIFDDENAVAPDLVWVSVERLRLILGEDGKLHDAPDLVVEVLSPGTRNIQRDRELKLQLYSVRGVREYWIVDWQARSLQVYRREAAALKLAATLYPPDELASPLLPGFTVPVERLFPIQ